MFTVSWKHGDGIQTVWISCVESNSVTMDEQEAYRFKSKFAAIRRWLAMHSFPEKYAEFLRDGSVNVKPVNANPECTALRVQKLLFDREQFKLSQEAQAKAKERKRWRTSLTGIEWEKLAKAIKALQRRGASMLGSTGLRGKLTAMASNWREKWLPDYSTILECCGTFNIPIRERRKYIKCDYCECAPCMCG